MQKADDAGAAGNPVARQYEQWVYPAPFDDLNDPSMAWYTSGFGALREHYWMYWPASPLRNLDILVAGCGSMAAACYAHAYPGSRVLGIDISAASLAHSQRLKQRYNLANLTLEQCPIEHVGQLKREFDFISCHGVLHHMADPVGGLRELGKRLRVDGVIGILVYGKYGRWPVYAFQELFRLMQLEQSAGDVAVVREMIGKLDASHYAGRYVRQAVDLRFDSGIVNTFLHRRDRSYSVAECLSLVRDAGLVFQGWDENALYHPDGLIRGMPLVRQHLDAMSEEDLWQSMEIITGQLAMHSFYACRADREAARYRIPWDSERLLDCVAVARGELVRANTPEGRVVPAVRWGACPPLELQPWQAAVFSAMDGRRTVRQCVQAAAPDADAATIASRGRELFRLLWRVGYVRLRLPAGTPDLRRRRRGSVMDIGGC